LALLFGGNSGLVNKALVSMGPISAPLPFMFTETGVVVALAHVLMPYMVLAVGALQRLDPQIENAAVALGAGPFTVLRRIVCPRSCPASCRAPSSSSLWRPALSRPPSSAGGGSRSPQRRLRRA
jgi:putative spermidine/putrescine transport system permease protein